MKYYLIIIAIAMGMMVKAQGASDPALKLNNEESVILTDSSNFQEGFVNKWELEDKTPLFARVLDEFELHSGPACSTEGINVVIPKDSTVYLYGFFKEYNCWATKYHGVWGFIPSSKVMSISKKTLSRNKYDSPPKLRSKIRKKYPKEAEQKGIVGTVSLKVFINKYGRVEKTKITKGIPELNQAAIDAIKDTKFEPAIYKNKKVGVWIPVSFDFN